MQRQLFQKVVAEAQRTTFRPVSVVFEPREKTEYRLEQAQQLQKHQFPSEYYYYIIILLRITGTSRCR